MIILFKYATRSRPERFEEGLWSITSNLSDGSHRKHKLMVTCDADDATMQPYKFYDQFTFGTSNNKIHAINRDMERAPYFDILVVMSDDMRFITKDFDKIIVADMTQHFPDLDGMLHYPDQHQWSNCMTMSIMGRKYYERDGFIYDPRCKSLWADIIAQETAMNRGKYKYIDTRLFNHLHPSFNDIPYDAQYRRTEAMDMRAEDYSVYLEAKKEYDPTNLFPIRSI